jgi:hypothetical protein
MRLRDSRNPPGQNSAARSRPKIYSIAALPRGREFRGRFNVTGSTYAFVYGPSGAEISGRKLRLLGRLTVTDPQGREHSQDRVRAELAATQGGAGGAPARREIVAATSPAAGQQARETKLGETRILPRTDNTGPTAFVGVMYLRLDPPDGARLGVPADLSRVQLNARLWPTDDLARNLQDVYSQLVEAVYGEAPNNENARILVAELNRLLKQA